MDAHGVDVFHAADGDGVVGAVAHDLKLDLLIALHGLFHQHLMDDSVEGVACAEANVMGTQYYPDAAQGPNETFDPFDDYVAMMKKANVNGVN